MTEQNAEPTSAPPPPAARVAPLRRRATDRVLGGVASGLADYLNVDPLLVRVVFVGLVIFGGAGVFIYLVAWLFVPVEGSDASIVESVIRRLGVSAGTAGTLAWVLLAIVATLLLLDWLRPAAVPFDGTPFDRESMGERISALTGYIVALAIIVGGVLLVRRTAGGRAPSADDATSADGIANRASAAPAAASRVARAERERSPLGLYVLGLLLVAVGVLAAVDGATVAEVLPAHYAGLALAVVGVGLIVGAWWGRARWLIALAVLLVPLALAASFVDIPLDAGWGDRRAAPTAAADIPDEYRLAGGRLVVDLRALETSEGERRVAATVGVGRLLVILPEGAAAEIDAEVGAGTTDLLGERREGTGLVERDVTDGSAGTFVLDLEAGIGEVVVRTARGEE